MPGDRLYIAERQWARFDNDIKRLMGPINTIGSSMQQLIGYAGALSGNVLGGGVQSQFGQVSGTAGQAAAESGVIVQ